MNKIKARDAAKDIKAFDRAADVGGYMKDAAIKSKDAVSSADRRAGRKNCLGSGELVHVSHKKLFTALGIDVLRFYSESV